MATSMIHRVAVQSPILALKDKYDSPYSLGGEKKNAERRTFNSLPPFKSDVNKSNSESESK